MIQCNLNAFSSCIMTNRGLWFRLVTHEATKKLRNTFLSKSVNVIPKPNFAPKVEKNLIYKFS